MFTCNTFLKLKSGRKYQFHRVYPRNAMPPKGIHYDRRVVVFHETRSVTDQRKLQKDRPITRKLPQLVYGQGILKLPKNLELPI